MEGVDYSFSRPVPATLKAAGKHFAIRYVGTQSSGKSLTRSEAVRLNQAGIDLVAVYQTTTNFMMSADGWQAALRAHDHAVSCGMPPDRPIYFALDTNPNSLTPSQWLGVERFLNSAALSIGRSRIGVYAGYAGIERLCPTFAPWGWQTYAWSAGRWSFKAQLQQYRNGVALAGGTVDLCRSTTMRDFGQWSYTPLATTPPTEEPKVHLVDCAGKPGLVIGLNGIQAIDIDTRNLLKYRFNVPVTGVNTADWELLWALRTPPVNIDAIITGIIAGLQEEGVPDGEISIDNISAAVRRIFADAGEED